MKKSLFEAAAGAVLLGAVSTLGDLIWKWFELRHRMATGVVHGALVLLAVGVFLGWLARPSGAVGKGALGGLVIGVAAAVSFYVFAPVLGFRAAFLSWALFWIALAILQGWLDGYQPRMGGVTVRGVVAGLFSGSAFYAISGIWFGPDAYQTPAYVNFIYWTFAFFPGFLALRWRTGRATPE